MADKNILYWDSCLFFEVLCDEPVPADHRMAIQKILEANKAKKNLITTSVLTHLECVPEKLDIKKPGAKESYEGMFDGVHFIDQQISANILNLAKEIRGFYYKPPSVDDAGGKMMDTGDAIHLATAIIYEADEFHTRDDKRKGSKVPLVSIYEYSGTDKICGKYPLSILSPSSDEPDLFS